MMDGSGPAEDPELELEIPSKPEYVRTVRHTVGALARLHGVRDDIIEDIKLAVSEACTTALGSNPVESKNPIMVRAWAGPESMVLEVLDRGSGPVKEVLGDPEELDTLDLPFETVLALPVIRGLVDEVAVSPRKGGGSRLRMTVSIHEEG
jgi:serine/threonine-protein kinase RsbW